MVTNNVLHALPFPTLQQQEAFPLLSMALHTVLILVSYDTTHYVFLKNNIKSSCRFNVAIIYQ